MSKKPVRDISVSVHHRLINLAHEQGKDPNQIRIHYVMERFLHRLALSPHSENFILKGGMLLSVLGTPSSRPTMDIDLLGTHVENTGKRISSIFKELIEIQTPTEDGVKFSAESIKTSIITKGIGYDGIRVECSAFLGRIPVKLKIDVGFGDVLHPSPEKHKIKALLQDMPTAEIGCYPKESVIAEKFQAMVMLGKLNTRMKDFYDIRFLSQHFEFEETKLREAINKTFTCRNTEQDTALSLFSEDFASYKQSLWKAFVRRINLDEISEDFLSIIRDLEAFLFPVLTGKANGCIWRPLHGWQTMNIVK